MLCGATLFGAKRAHFAGVPTHSPQGNAGDASRHTWSKAPFPAPSVVHLPGRLLPGFHHPRLSWPFQIFLLSSSLPFHHSGISAKRP